MLYSAEAKFTSYESGLRVLEKEVYSSESIDGVLEAIENVFLSVVLPFSLEKEKEIVQEDKKNYYFRYDLDFLFRPGLEFHPFFPREFLQHVFSRSSHNPRKVNNRFAKKFREGVFSSIKEDIEKYDLERMFLRLILRRSIYDTREKIIDGKVKLVRGKTIEYRIPIFRTDVYIKKRLVF